MTDFRSAILAFVGTLIAAVGVAGGTVALAEDDPYVLTPTPPVATPPPVLPPVVIPVPGPPMVAVIDLTRDHPESFTVPPAPPPEVADMDTQVSEVVKPADTGMGSDVEQWRSLATAHFGDGADVALCLMAHESGGNPNAYNPSGASGLMQVLASWADDFGVSPDDLFDPDTNLRISAALYADGGWGHWSPWNRGECH